MMIKSTLREIPLVLICATLITLWCGSCEAPEKVAYSHFEQIPSSGWDPMNVLVFEPWPADSAEAANRTYNMDMVLRYTSRKPAFKFPMVMTIENDNGTVRSDTLMLSADSDKETKGKIHYGVREVTINLDKSVRLSDGYTVMLSPLSSPEYTEGLLNIGIMLIRQ